MLLAPQPEEERAIDTRQLPPPMQPGMAATTERDLPGRFLRARPAMVDEQLPVSQTDLTTAVPPEECDRRSGVKPPFDLPLFAFVVGV